jgi:hypothetical protein
MRIGKNCETIEGSLKCDNFCHLQAQDEKLNTKLKMLSTSSHLDLKFFTIRFVN